MTITVQTALLNNQSILQNFALVEEIDEQFAEIISGGKSFTIINNTQHDLTFKLDGKEYSIKPNEEHDYDSDCKGRIRYDRDCRHDHDDWKESNLCHGKRYEFKDNYKTSCDYDIKLSQIK